MVNKLSINQRIFVTIIYIVVFLIICFYSSESFNFLTDSSSHYNLLFASGALLLIFGTYITEPYFTKPVDVITNCIAIILALGGINDKAKYIRYDYVFYTTFTLLLLSIINVLISKNTKVGKLQELLFKIVTLIGKSKVSFSIIYLLTLISYFHNKPIDFIFFLTFWVVFISQFLFEGIVLWASDIISIFVNKKEIKESIGEAIGCDNPLLYKVEVDLLNGKELNVEKGELVYLQDVSGYDIIGIVVNKKQLLNKKRLSIYFLQNSDGSLIKVEQNKHMLRKKGSIFFKSNLLYKLNLEDLNDDDKNKVTNNYFYQNKNNFIGYVSHGSNIHQVRFELLIDSLMDSYARLKEGSIITVDIHNEKTLYQVIDGVTYEEVLDKHDKYGYLTGIAQKLGKYEFDEKSIEIVKRVPSIYSPAFFDMSTGDSIDLKKSIGTLPETSLDIEIKSFDDLVTHNTAILGILGIGKSCLTFELIKKVIDNTDCKVICIDITNEYYEELKQYCDSEKFTVDNESAFNSINEKYGHIEEIPSGSSTKQDPEKSGNLNGYKLELRKDICNFMFDSDTIPENKFISTNKRVRIYNPDYHKVSKGEKIGFNVLTTDLTQAEKTRAICEAIYSILMKLGVSSNKKARVLIVFEEAHSLIPERNSTANEGDKSAVNGTSKVILQGRKYGLGSFVVTQRTANISKSILNQCNTIFGLRVFDDTGKQFLENYIGSSYANTLPTLEERHAIVIGKALKLKQPIIIKLNDKNKIILPTTPS